MSMFRAGSTPVRAVAATFVLLAANSALPASAGSSDLVIQEIAAAPGASTTRDIRLSLANVGSGSAGTSRGWLLASRDAVIDSSDLLLASFDVPALAPTATASIVVRVTLLADTPYLIAVADAGANEAEANEVNNVRVAHRDAAQPYDTPGTLRVCPTCPYKLLSQAGAVVQAGQTILVEPTSSMMVDCLVIARSNVTIRGVLDRYGRRPWIGGKSCVGKGILVAQDLALRNLTIEGLELSGAKVVDGNGAAIRFQGLGLTLRNVFLHDNENGLLSGGATGTSTIAIQHSVFVRNGSASRPGKQHNVYVSNTGGTTLDFIGNISLAAAYEGHELKTRTEFSNVACNVIASLSSRDSYTIDFPLGGDVWVSDNVLQQGPETTNKAMFSFAREASPHAVRTLRMARNTILNDRAGAYFFAMFPDTVLTLSHDEVIGSGLLVGTGPAPWSDTGARYASRAAYRFATGSTLPDWSSTAPTLPDLSPSCARVHPRTFASMTTYVRELMRVPAQ